jgi:arylformamidase
MKIIDLTHLLNSDITVYPGTEKPVFVQANTVEKDGFAEQKMTMYTHTGTHIDAPFHMLANGKSLDQMSPPVFNTP